MSTHLSAQEFVEALDGMLGTDRQAHVAACDECAHQIIELTAMMREAHGAGAVPEPSPLFWDRFSERVHAAVAAEPVRPLSWWERAWKPVVVVSAVAAAVLVAVLIGDNTAPAPVTQVAAGVPAGAPVTEPVFDEDAMAFMVQMVSTASTEELRSARPGKDATASAIDELTPEEQAEFIRLLKVEIGEQQ